MNNGSKRADQEQRSKADAATGTSKKTNRKKPAIHFDAFQGIVQSHELGGRGRVKAIRLLTTMRFLENGRGKGYKASLPRSVSLTVTFGPDKDVLPRKENFPPGCPVRGRVQGKVEEHWLFGFTLTCLPGSFDLVRDEAEELALLDGLHEYFDQSVRREKYTDPKDFAWERFFLARSRRRLTGAGLLRKGQRSRRLCGDCYETRIITAAESGLPGITLAALYGHPSGIPRILACGSPPIEGGATHWTEKAFLHGKNAIGSHSQGWYKCEQFFAVSLGECNIPPLVLEGRITVPQERLPALFAWVRWNQTVLHRLWRMGTFQAAEWPVAAKLRNLADAPDWMQNPEGEEDPWAGNARFEETLARLFGDMLRADKHFCVRLWSSLANIRWLHEDGVRASFSFRAAGGLIADIRGEKEEYSYMNWYMSGEDGRVHSEIAAPLAREGWIWETPGFTQGDTVDYDIRNEMTAGSGVTYVAPGDWLDDVMAGLEKKWNRLLGNKAAGGKKRGGKPKLTVLTTDAS